MKKILLFLIDSMMPHVLEQCLKEKKAPALQFFMERGDYVPDCVTVFPTMTASVDCSLITGHYPDRHGIPGLVWYDHQERQMVNYINGAKPIYRIGIDRCACNVLFDLNERHLNKEITTIHEDLEDRGFTSGSLNVIAHRGRKKHPVRLPFLVDAITGFRLRGEVSGPGILSLGTLVQPDMFRSIPWNLSHTLLSSYGINDAFGIDVLIEVIRSGRQPDFTLIYMPDNDHKLHVSPRNAIEHLAEVDRQLARVLDSFESWEQALEKNIFLFISDHGQTAVGDGEEYNIPLEKLLKRFRLHRLGNDVSDNDEIVICNNERMTYLYPLKQEIFSQVVEAVAVDGRIDLIAWKEAGGVAVRRGGTRQELRFWRGGEEQDVYGAGWRLKGDRGVLDLRKEGGTLHYGVYPDGLARLYGALYSQNTQMIVLTAAPGYEFLSECSPTHLGGGSHGSLHLHDSIIPLLVVGAAHRFPRPARLVDVKNFVMQEMFHHAPALV